MNDTLEKKIRKHVDILFDREPPTDHRERFAVKLAARKKKRHTVMIRRICGITAAAAAVIISAVFLPIPFAEHAGNSDDEPFGDVRNYYVMLLEDEVESTRQLLELVDSRNREEILQDIELLRAEPVFILEKGEQNETLLVNVYSSKIEALQHIQNILSEKF
ncbi:MAG: hypothetical protein LBJ23_04770 [Tannerella sp.]|jgi:hypothetical protein|nr:hypothetical protein [Tannerella sp.]